MIAEKMKGLVANSSAIRAMFEEGNRLAGIYGAENVFDFSLCNRQKTRCNRFYFSFYDDTIVFLCKAAAFTDVRSITKV